MDDATPFLDFRNRLWKCFKVPDADAWEGGHVSMFYSILEGTNPLYEFDFAHARTTQDLLLGAILLSSGKSKMWSF